MKIKSFASVMEELTNRQKDMVDDWLGQERLPTPERKTSKYDPTRNPNLQISHHIFGDKTEIDIPLLSMDEIASTVPHAAVKDHLEKNGFAVSDYKKGTAKDKYGREVRIGRVLERTNAPDIVKKTFTNDTSRAATKKSGMSITITRHPYEVAGMSTNRGWKSCLGMPRDLTSEEMMDKGFDSKPQPNPWQSSLVFLPEEVIGGTHVAYLGGIKNPVARIALRQYREMHPTTGKLGSHTVLRPDRVYGTANDQFYSTVMKWAEDNFPVKPKTAYQLDPSVYEEKNVQSENFIRPTTTQRYIYENSPDTLKHFVTSMSINPEVQKIGREIVASHPAKLAPELIDELLNTRHHYDDVPGNTDQAHWYLSRRKDLEPRHIDMLLGMNDSRINEQLKRRKDLLPYHKERLKV